MKLCFRCFFQRVQEKNNGNMIVLQIVQQFCVFCCFLNGMQEKKIIFLLFYEGVQKKITKTQFFLQ